MLASLIPAQTKTLGDVGTDHAGLPILAMRRGLVGRAVASDLREGPLRAASRNIAAAALTDRIETRLGGGLEPYAAGECDTVVIAGMGGLLIRDILEAGLRDGKIRPGSYWIFEPNTQEEKLRSFLAQYGFRTEAERALTEDGHVYLFILAVYDGTETVLSEEEAAVGRANLLPPFYYQNIIRKKEKRLAGLAQRRETDAETEAEKTLLYRIIRAAAEKEEKASTKGEF